MGERFLQPACGAGILAGFFFAIVQAWQHSFLGIVAGLGIAFAFVALGGRTMS